MNYNFIYSIMCIDQLLFRDRACTERCRGHTDTSCVYQ